MTKKELRNLYKQKRQNLSSKEKLKLDDLLLIRFQQLYFEDIHVLFTYWPKATAQEPNTHLFSGYLRHTIPSLQIAYPVTDFSTCAMQAVFINEETVYHTNAYGITEPDNGSVVEPRNIDLVFVPFLVCDAHGYRVGYGKGFYDKYLAQCREDIIKIGFSYFDPIEKIEDRNSFDVPLDYCLTPGKVYEF
jgi:5-formyltetrahydrofolate cyclo-ligase